MATSLQQLEAMKKALEEADKKYDALINKATDSKKQAQALSADAKKAKKELDPETD